MDRKIYYDGYTLDGELSRFYKVWISIIISFIYSFIAGKLIPKGIPRLLAFFPIISLFFFLPLNLHSMHLGGITAFLITWLANFKLLLFAFDIGPLSSDQSLSLPKFLAVACFPIKIQHKTQNNRKPTWNYAIKGLLLASLIGIYDFRDLMHPICLTVLHFLHMYSFLELLLASMAATARILLGVELEPQFNEPYLSTSLQDFWGRRWNIMVSRILRPTVYDPCLRILTRICGRKWAAVTAVMATFFVSALMHEIIFFYLCRNWPTGMTSWFFVFHGFCLVLEIMMKKTIGVRFGLPTAVATVMTVAFVIMTAFWWFLPELLRCNAVERSFEEYRIVGEMMKEMMVRFENYKYGI
ncbi:acyl-CoA--sterol O-acyltransferase 1-like [Impatiens glandulifera]|uniref:acyl-CoA--sterol O-acyltransferase 1-like n=1 Tax=Impatiens glandulifera TaxID=253017 RepID=UPI001FB16E3E|nr:acyl-CoA--sterol O-acyltransferase 1-like [Impatiens glandulifera]